MYKSLVTLRTNGHDFWGTFRMYLREQALGFRRPDQIIDIGHAFQCGQALFVGGHAADRSIQFQADADGHGGEMGGD